MSRFQSKHLWGRITPGNWALKTVLPNVPMTLTFVLIGLGIGSSSLTFGWIVSHNVDGNFFPEFSGAVIYLSDVLLSMGLGLWIVVRILRRGISIKLGPLYVLIPLVVLLAWSWLSVFWAPDTTVAIWSAARRTLLMAMYIVIVTDWIRFHRIAVGVLVGYAILQSGVALAQVYQHSAIGLGVLGELRPGALNYEVIGAGRGYGLGFNPNPIGAVIAIGALISFGLLIVRPNRIASTTLLLVILVFTLFGVGATGSRSAIIGLAAGSIGITLLGLRSTSNYFSFLKPYVGHVILWIIMAGGVFMILSSGQGRLQALGLERFTPAQLTSGLSSRNRDITLSFPIIKNANYLGVGAGNYPLVLKKRIAPNAYSPKLTPAHNVPLLILAELGVVGLIAWSVLAISPVAWFLEKVRKERTLPPRSYLWFAPLVVVYIESFFDFTPWATQDGRIYFVAILALWAGAVGTVIPETNGGLSNGLKRAE